MFCANCGTNVNEDVIFCPNCGKSPKGIAINESNQVKPQHNFPLFNLTKRLFGLFFEISLWLILIIGTVLGAFIGAELNQGIGAILGFIIGLTISLIFIVLAGGIVSIFVKMSDDINELKKAK